MVPISTLRETLVLVIFGIVLVPIAAKRAQDAPGYWKAFAANAQALAHCDLQPPPPAFVLCTSCGDAASPGRPVKPYTLRNGTNPTTIESRLEATGPLTLRLRLSKSKPEDGAAMGQVVAGTNTAKVSTGSRPTAVDGAVPPTVTTTSAANRERWTLIWMGTAIMVVAVFMSFC